VQPQKLKIARAYLESASFVSDLGVLVATINVILRPSKAGEGPAVAKPRSKQDG
jgi:hypothetical protein